QLLQAGLEPSEAANAAVAKLEQLTGSTGGLIVIDCHGQFGYARNTTHMPVCAINRSGNITLDS
ncbi:MAG TPA: peptidase T, partial [Candidatus Binatia bacterium]